MYMYTYNKDNRLTNSKMYKVHLHITGNKCIRNNNVRVIRRSWSLIQKDEFINKHNAHINLHIFSSWVYGLRTISTFRHLGVLISVSVQVDYFTL